jgi:hypothetical protein
MAQQAPPELIGIHVNFSGAAPPDVAKALQSGGPPPAGLSAEEQRAYDQMAFLYRHVPTQLMMAAHPQTLYGLADSPVALAAWMIDHDVASYGHIVKLFVDGEPYGDLTRLGGHPKAAINRHLKTGHFLRPSTETLTATRDSCSSVAHGKRLGHTSTAASRRARPPGLAAPAH